MAMTMTRARRGLDVRETTYTLQGHVKVLEHPDRGPVTYCECDILSSEGRGKDNRI
jgi:hypothetical protein